MRHRMCVLALIAMIGPAPAALAQGTADETSLKLVHETVVKSVTSGNLAVVQGMIHPRASGFFHDRQQLVQLGSGVTATDILPTLVTDLGHFVSTATDPGYRVLGTVGVVNMTALQKRKGNERGSDCFVRGTDIYLGESGSWKLVSWHGSDTPLKK